MSTVTRAIAMKNKLVEVAKARPGLQFLVEMDAIWNSAYAGTYRPQQLLWFGEVLWADDRAVTFGKMPNSRDEEFNIRFGIEINDGDQDQEEANAKVETILEQVETMAADLRLFSTDIGGLITMGVVPVGLGEGPGNADGTRAAIFAGNVNVRARK